MKDKYGLCCDCEKKECKRIVESIKDCIILDSFIYSDESRSYVLQQVQRSSGDIFYISINNSIEGCDNIPIKEISKQEYEELRLAKEKEKVIEDLSIINNIAKMILDKIQLKPSGIYYTPENVPCRGIFLNFENVTLIVLPHTENISVSLIRHGKCRSEYNWESFYDAKDEICSRLKELINLDETSL